MKKIYNYLIKYKLYKLISFLYSAYSLKLNKKFTKIFYDEVWIHKQDNEYFADRRINLRIDFRKEFNTFKNEWLYIYQPQKGDIIVDIGAGIGTEVYHFSKFIGENGKIFAIEAHPETFKCLEKLIEYNNLYNVLAINSAITDRECEVVIDDPVNHISASILSKTGENFIEGLTLDKVVELNRIEKIDYLKMNIEGAERLAIKGMRESLKITKHICISCHDFKSDRGDSDIMRTKKIIIDFLENNNFKVNLRNDTFKPWINDQVNAYNKNRY